MHGTHPCTGKGNQMKDLSWWPKVTTWEGSGLDAGIWTPGCKHWFQKRLASIRSGQVGLYTSTEWGKYLRYLNNIRNFLERFKGVGEKFLVEDCRKRPLNCSNIFFLHSLSFINHHGCFNFPAKPHTFVLL